MCPAACRDGRRRSLLLALAPEGTDLLAGLVLVVEQAFVVHAALLGGEGQRLSFVGGRLAYLYERLSGLAF